MTISKEPLNLSDEPDVDEVEAALSNLEVTLEGGNTDKILVCTPASWKMDMYETGTDALKENYKSITKTFMVKTV